jgi:hypothetical protein
MICNKRIHKKFISRKALQLHQIRIHNNNNIITIDDKEDRYLWINYKRMDKTIYRNTINMTYVQ